MEISEECRFWTGHFRRLAELMRDAGFFDLERQYPDPLGVTDLPSRITSALRGGTWKTVTSTDISFVIHGGAMYPIGLWAVEMAVLAIAADLKWRESSPEKPGLGQEGNDPMWDREIDR